MKTTAINNTNPNFSGIRVKPNTLTKTFYSAILSASLLGASMNAADSFSKTKDKEESKKTEIVNNTNEANPFAEIPRQINRAFDKKEDSSFGTIAFWVAAVILGIWWNNRGKD